MRAIPVEPVGDRSTGPRRRVVAAVILALSVALAACSFANGGNCYERLTTATTERERIEILKRETRTTPSQESLAGIARYWMENLEYVESHPTLEVLVASALYEHGYHEPTLETWVLTDLAESQVMDRRRRAWTFLCYSTWNVPEQKLLNAVERERKFQASGEYTDIEAIHDSIARVGRRLYPESTWWQPLIQTRYGK